MGLSEDFRQGRWRDAALLGDGDHGSWGCPKIFGQAGGATPRCSGMAATVHGVVQKFSARAIRRIRLPGECMEIPSPAGRGALTAIANNNPIINTVWWGNGGSGKLFYALA
jgi:hypothetical protein